MERTLMEVHCELEVYYRYTSWPDSASLARGQAPELLGGTPGVAPPWTRRCRAPPRTIRCRAPRTAGYITKSAPATGVVQIIHHLSRSSSPYAAEGQDCGPLRQV